MHLRSGLLQCIYYQRSQFSKGTISRSPSDWILSNVINRITTHASISCSTDFPRNRLPPLNFISISTKITGFDASGTRSAPRPGAQPKFM